MEHTVVKRNGFYRLYVVDIITQHVVEEVVAHKAQLISDYLWMNWPVGTKVRWLVRP